ncbi:hypothetical protein EVAR_99759_1 [Eumeta japonica]|uniref:Uncharacterized protein n=1 Tax=Eumeta variegata TaxID=151549 RepID=A0A4C1ZF32_EUMVA|nr:hypothetical protein EVAR_99759_1 [Eumeta japonica]
MRAALFREQDDRNRIPILVVGPTGTGKSSLMLDLLLALGWYDISSIPSTSRREPPPIRMLVELARALHLYAGQARFPFRPAPRTNRSMLITSVIL